VWTCRGTRNVRSRRAPPPLRLIRTQKKPAGGDCRPAGSFHRVEPAGIEPATPCLQTEKSRKTLCDSGTQMYILRGFSPPLATSHILGGTSVYYRVCYCGVPQGLELGSVKGSLLELVFEFGNRKAHRRDGGDRADSSRLGGGVVGGDHSPGNAASWKRQRCILHRLLEKAPCINYLPCSPPAAPTALLPVPPSAASPPSRACSPAGSSRPPSRTASLPTTPGSPVAPDPVLTAAAVDSLSPDRSLVTSDEHRVAGVAQLLAQRVHADPLDHEAPHLLPGGFENGAGGRG
jgi:hypothetical protein